MQRDAIEHDEGAARPRPGSRLCHPIAQSAHGADAAAGVATELLAQVVDIGVDGVVGQEVAVWPGGVEELVAAERLSRMAHQAFEERELPAAELDRCAVD